MAKDPEGEALIEQISADDFRLTVLFDDQTFDCGSYINRGAAQQAGRLFLDRKRAESVAAGKRPRKKK
jgi:hypothetical protein